jgi:predicted DCC family thiol-disulfide oxidoreductase YuxK
MGTYPLLEENNPIVFFDSTCLLCNKSVQVLLKSDKKSLFKLASLSSDYGVQVRSLHKIEEDSIILYHNKKIYLRSLAVLRICRLLGFPYNLMSVFYLVPRVLRDALYGLIARYRTKWFGKTDRCLIPSEKYTGRIIL